MNYTKEQLSEMLNKNTDLGIDNANALQATARPQQANKVQGSKIVPPEKADAPVDERKRHAVIKLGYPGCVITENHAYGRNGNHSYMKAEAREWQNDLIVLVKNCGIKDWQLPLKVRVEGTFKNLRECPDLHNFKCLYDGIQVATGLNDKNFHTETIPGVIDKTVEPFILITIEEL